MNCIQAAKFLFIICCSTGCFAQSFNLVVGTYTTGRSEGIYVYDFNPRTGNVQFKNKAAGVENPTYLAMSADKKHLYSVNTVGNGNGGVSSFRFDPVSGQLQFLNRISSRGDNPVFVSVDRNNTHAFTANYAGGNFSATRILKDGSLGAEVQVFQNSGTGPDTARQSRPHVHMTLLSPDQHYLLVSDLGIDKINVYKRTANPVKPLAYFTSVTVKAGGGPRHMIFHPDRKYFYALLELTGDIIAYRFGDGSLKELGAYNHLPDHKGLFSASDIGISPDGKFLYASYRADLNEIAIYSVNEEDGALSYIDSQSAMGKSPRSLIIDTEGEYLLVANQHSDEIRFFRRNKRTGLLTPMKQKIEVGNPSCILLVDSD
jgi:6-phosphogluconolactonase